MKIEKEHFIDCSEKDENGLYEYYYEYDIYTISFTDITYFARSYVDEPKQISFLSFTASKDNKRVLFDTIPYKDINFQECLKYFRKELGFEDFKILLSNANKAYNEIDLTKLPSL